MRLAVLFLGLAACAAPAFAQNSVNVYNWTDYTVEGQEAEFEKQTGIKVNYTTFSTNEILDAKLRSGQWSYDVVFPSDTPFFANQVRDNLYQRLDRSKLKNWGNIAPDFLAALTRSDRGNVYGVPYAWGTIGIGYNAAEIAKRMPGAPTDSLRMIFDPAVVAKFADCGVMMLDSPNEVFPAALAYLGLDPISRKRKEINAAAEAVRAIRRYVRKFDSLDYIYGLGDGQACLVFGSAGGVFQAQERTKKTGKNFQIVYAQPREGSMLWVDVAGIPKNATNVDNAYKFIDFLLEPRIAATMSEKTGYASANRAAVALLPKQILDNPMIYPPPSVRAKLYTVQAESTERMREIDRQWEAAKRGR